MMIRRSRTDAMVRMRTANPFDAGELAAAIDEAELGRAMRRAIAAGEAPERPIPVGDRIALERGAGGGRAAGSSPATASPRPASASPASR